MNWRKNSLDHIERRLGIACFGRSEISMDYIDLTISNLHNICEECGNYGTTNCVKAQCNVGFSITMMEYKKKSKNPILNDGISMIPNEDTKYYDTKKIARGIASICKACKECNDGHSEFCPISLARKSIEGTILKDLEAYPGNVLAYLVNVGKQNPDIANLIMEEFKNLE